MVKLITNISLLGSTGIYSILLYKKIAQLKKGVWHNKMCVRFFLKLVRKLKILFLLFISLIHNKIKVIQL